MGIISVENTDRLFWLGRYLERVCFTTGLFATSYDTMIDSSETEYVRFCEVLEIPNIYTSQEDFCQRYCFDENDPNSIYLNLQRAYDNAIVLRDEIGSESLSYVQLAIYEMNKAKDSEAPMIELQRTIDDIWAFWGVTDDIIACENVRNIIKVGKRVERIDLLGRLHRSREDIAREVHRLSGRIPRTCLSYQKDVIERLNRMVEEEELDYFSIVNDVDNLLVV